LDQNVYMGVRIREELKQTLILNLSNHERKRMIMNQIENTKKTNPHENAIATTDLTSVDQPKKLEDEKNFTLDQ